ncbi:LOW QUALITY PROTEIN: hypothetical protein T265_14533 [Opisthorchis viverrini]|uniref:CRAL-TRIO domain-containing protein n=1 Tax=Opisthorchis viverrini TaxID=6198 RepID=A0A074Z9P1_OPIVI|nr:LOW QUALITY PROTEIN: hypothetical protein T265_14533 [Opisthorchis viverrini]KER23951.1 LOW QUALITY PROTEIN: hypothetical protein T265_14533 [Opisthorchis viverrini]
MASSSRELLSPSLKAKAKRELREQPEHIDAHVESFRRWIKSLPHITFPCEHHLLIPFLRYAKYNHAKAQQRLDNFCTIRASKELGAPRWFDFPPLNDPLLDDYLKSGQLSVLHQAASCFSRYDIRDIRIHLCNVLLIRLLKIRRQPTTAHFRCLTAMPCRREHEGWDTARLLEPSRGKSRSRYRVRTTDLPVMLDLGRTTEGLSVILIRLGNWNMDVVNPSSLRCFSYMDVDRFLLDPVSQIAGFIFFFDLTGVGKKHFVLRSNQKEMRLESKVWRDAYPIRVRHVIYYNEPKVMDIIFKFVEIWMSSKVRERVGKCGFLEGDSQLGPHVPISMSVRCLNNCYVMVTTYHFGGDARWPKWLEREFTDRKVRGSNRTSASRLPLFRLGQPGSSPVLMQPSGDMAVRYRRVLQLNDHLGGVHISLLISGHSGTAHVVCVTTDRMIFYSALPNLRLCGGEMDQVVRAEGPWFEPDPLCFSTSSV